MEDKLVMFVDDEEDQDEGASQVLDMENSLMHSKDNSSRWELEGEESNVSCLNAPCYCL